MQKEFKTLDDLRQLWAEPSPPATCSSEECRASRTIHIQAESITITNLILTGEVPAELREALKRAAA